MGTSEPIFIGGMFKSGTSLLRAMLGQHSAIAAGLETYWFDLDLPVPPGEPVPDEIRRLAAFFDLRPAGVEAMSRSAQTAEAFLEAFMGTVAERQGKPRWAEKTPANVAHLDRIWSHWGTAQVLHIVRDPRDVYASLCEAGKWADPEDFADRWESTVAACEHLKRMLTPSPSRYMELRYENLTLSPESTIRRVLEFLGEPWEEQVARFAGRDQDYERVKEVTGKGSTTLQRLAQPLSTSRVGIWRTVLDGPQLSALRAAIAAKGLEPLFSRIAEETPAAPGY